MSMQEDEINNATNEDEMELEPDVVFEETDESGGEQRAQGKMKDLRTQLAEAKSQRDEYLAGWQKSKADYINLKNEQDEARKNLRTHIKHDCVQDLLPTLDSFEMAMAGEAWESVESNWRVGVEYIYQQLQKLLEEYGVSEIAETAVPFDPLIHQPMETTIVQDESQNDQVLNIIQKGYRAGNTIIRAAKVNVGKLEE